MKKYLAEMVGTMVLTLLGCGTAVSLNCGSDTASVVGTAVAFGLAVVAMAYTIGGVSGCHINPAITLGCLISKRISGKDAGMYMVFQVIGAIIGAAILFALTYNDMEQAGGTLTGANSCGNHGVVVGLIAEIVLTCIFVLVVLGTTDAKKGAGNFAGLAHSLHRHICEPCPFHRPCSLRRWSGFERPLGLHRWSICGCCSCRWHLENHRLRRVKNDTRYRIPIDTSYTLLIYKSETRCGASLLFSRLSSILIS